MEGPFPPALGILKFVAGTVAVIVYGLKSSAILLG